MTGNILNFKALLRSLGVLYLLNNIRGFKNKLISYLNRFAQGFKYYFYNSYLTKFLSYYIRTAYLRNILKIKIGKNTSIHMGCFFAGSKIRIGDNCVIARHCYLDGRIGQIDIHNNVSIAPEAYILSMSHDINSPTFGILIKPVIIEDFVWIASRVMIMPGVCVSKGSVIAAGSVVTKNVDAYSIVAGCPAKRIGERIKELSYTLKYFPFFNSDIQ